MNQPRVKLFSTWIGERPEWYNLFESQWARFQSVSWENVIPWFADIPVSKMGKKQLTWLNARVKDGLGLEAYKNVDSLCDLRPCFGELFADRLRGFEWWGWCDVDVMAGDLDKMLPDLLTDCDVLNFKPNYLSGCFVLFRNMLETRNLWRTGKDHYSVFASQSYYVWDESGSPRFNDIRFWDLVQRSHLRVRAEHELMSYDALNELLPIEMRDNRLLCPISGREYLFHHFMTNVWPVKSDGSSRFRGS